MITVLSNVPIWVFPLFFLLIFFGLRAAKDRSAPTFLIYALPLLGILTLRNILALSPPVWLWFVAALAYACGIALGMKWQRKWLISKDARRVHLKGEWVTLTAMMIIFAAGFANGFLSDVMPNLAQSTTFALIFTCVTCLPAGQFLGRAITTLRAPINQAR